MPKPSAARLVATAVALPPLEPAVLERRIVGVADRAADGADAEVAERKLVEVGLAEDDRAARASCRRPRANRAAAGDRRSARDPPVVGSPSASMLSLKTIGTPWNGPRTRPAARSASQRARVGDRARVERQHRRGTSGRGDRRATAAPGTRGRCPRTSTSPRVIASCSCGDRLLEHGERRGRRCGRRRVQLTICERCRGVRPRRSGAATSRRAIVGHARDLRCRPPESSASAPA